MDEVARAAGVGRRRARDVARRSCSRRRRRLGSTASGSSCPTPPTALVIKVDALRAAAAARRDQPRAALGDRVQVPGRAGDVEAARGRAQRRAHRRDHAARPLRAGRAVAARPSSARRSSTTTRSSGSTSRIGDRVLLEKAGEIIPYVITVVERGADRVPIVEPTDCPSCGTPLVREEGQVALLCPNTLRLPGAARALDRVLLQARRDEHREPRPVAGRRSSCDTGLVADVADLFDLTVEKLVELERMGAEERRERGRRHRSRRSEKATLTRLLVGLGMPKIGEVWAHEVAHALRRSEDADGRRGRQQIFDRAGRAARLRRRAGARGQRLLRRRAPPRGACTS